ncbi:NADH:flavin oxidoreductase [Luteithermobacter gelatinilyticus]|uniref:NADH:flavin oxidoreductase n=1 Tax=Luteithermobacter gelatinilyticus TaxID=2582913 RepID=UPI00110636EE|nr:NADH:flavin oxidoreductase [Luteithermobacter gelatinilyticus]
MVKSKAFEPLRLGSLRLRNRVIKAATYEGMTPGGIPTKHLTEYHRGMAAGGVALTTVAYGGVSGDGLTFKDQIILDDRVISPLRKLTDAVHREGAAAAIQLSHCGAFTRSPTLSSFWAQGPSFSLNSYGLFSGIPFARAMTVNEIARTVEAYGRAAAVAREAGFDALEIHMGHGYLLSQFISPATNRRQDQYGGTLINRMRFPVEVLQRVRGQVGADLPILIKMNLCDGFEGGLTIEEAIRVAQILEKEGADALVMSGGFVSRTPMYLFRGQSPLEAMIASEASWWHRWILKLGGKAAFYDMPYEDMYFLPLARKIRTAVRMPLVLLGGIKHLAHLDKAMAEGFDMVAMGRALIHQPDLIARYQAGKQKTSTCRPCNKCVGEMARPGGVRCALSLPDNDQLQIQEMIKETIQERKNHVSRRGGGGDRRYGRCRPDHM